jgi:large subunit ribosomal protein L32
MEKQQVVVCARVVLALRRKGKMLSTGLFEARQRLLESKGQPLTDTPPSHDRTVTMAALHVPSASFMAAFLPIARAQLLPGLREPVLRRIPILQRLRALASFLPAALAPIPALLGDLWDGLLNAVPKKKTSHMKKRHRQMASGKHLRDVTALNKCSACGRTKRAHVLCPYCVMSTLLDY